MLTAVPPVESTLHPVRTVAMYCRATLIFLLAWLTGACSTVQEPGAEPAPVEDHGADAARSGVDTRSTPSGQVQSAAPESGAGHESAVPPSVPRVPAQDPVVVALLAEADARLGRGQTENAAAVLERALRLAPQDAVLWHRMARLRLEQGRWQQAIVFARKSESLASANPELRAANSRLIARAVEMSGKGD